MLWKEALPRGGGAPPGTAHRAQSPEGIRVMKLFSKLPPATQTRVAAVFEQDTILLKAAESKAATPSHWLLNKDLVGKEVLLGSTWEIHEGGESSLRIADVTELLEDIGRPISNPANFVRYYADANPPLAEIISDKPGRAGMKFRLTAEGFREAEALKHKYAPHA